jgi:uncharacterized protein DUF732
MTYGEHTRPKTVPAHIGKHARCLMSLAPILACTTTLLAATAGGIAPAAHADEVAYLVNVTVRPGYDFPNADAAVGYGRGICDSVAGGESYATIIDTVGSDLGSADVYQASYLITQAVGELCPTSIWQLRNSAAGYRPGSPV